MKTNLNQQPNGNPKTKNVYPNKIGWHPLMVISEITLQTKVHFQFLRNQIIFGVQKILPFLILTKFNVDQKWLLPFDIIPLLLKLFECINM